MSDDQKYGEAATDAGKCSPTSTVGLTSLRNLWHHPIAAGKPLESLRVRHRNSGHTCGRYFPRSTTARPSGCRCKSAHPHQPPLGALPIPQGEPLDDSPLPTRPIRDTTITDNDAQLLGGLPSSKTDVKCGRERERGTLKNQPKKTKEIRDR